MKYTVRTDSSLQGYDVKLCEWFPVLHRMMLGLPSWISIFLWLLILKDEGSTILGNIWDHSPNDSASHPRRHESAATPH
jgi:hypothetical protein